MMQKAEDFDRFKPAQGGRRRGKVTALLEWQTQWGSQIPSLLEIKETTGIVPKVF